MALETGQKSLQNFIQRVDDQIETRLSHLEQHLSPQTSDDCTMANPRTLHNSSMLEAVETAQPVMECLTNRDEVTAASINNDVEHLSKELRAAIDLLGDSVTNMGREFQADLLRCWTAARNEIKTEIRNMGQDMRS